MEELNSSDFFIINLMLDARLKRLEGERDASKECCEEENFGFIDWWETPISETRDLILKVRKIDDAFFHF